ncbi:MAG: DUF2079 domain-containing protein [Candidatus Omnitrophica bacterium]|nr:DUF2079 domain-containing protein [Candidatus Omnitrophota bacterium]
MKITSSAKFADRIALLLCGSGFLVWSWVLTIKFNNFGYYDWDLSLYSQSMWQIIHGSVFVSLFGMNFLGNHAEYISFLIAPVYYFFPHPLTLVYLNLFAFFVSAFVLYRIFKLFLSPLASVLLCFVYIFYPSNIFMLVYEFHFESIALPFISGMFFFYITKRFAPFIICGILACICKENIPSFLTMFGVASFFRTGVNKKLWCGVPLTLGLLYFLSVMFIVMPFIRRDMPHPGNIYWGLFQGLGSSPQEILLSFFTKPLLVIKILFSQQNIQYLFNLLSPLCFASVLMPWPLLVGGPVFLQNMFSCVPMQHTVYFHYAATLGPSVFVAAAMGMAHIKKHLRQITFRMILLLILTLSLVNFIHYRPALLPRLSMVRYQQANVRQEMVNAVPPGAPVVASFDLLSHLTSRSELYAFYNVWLGRNLFIPSTFNIPSSVKYAVVDLSDPWLKDAYRNDPQGVDQRVKAFLSDGWKSLKQSHGLFLLHR